MIETLFSIPMLSLLLIPALSSYTTSLNLVFFYVTWTTLVLSHPPLRVEIFGTLATRLVFYVFPSILFFLFDILTPSAAVVVKAQGDIGLPSGSKRGKIRWKEFKVAGWSLINMALGIAVQAGLELLRTRFLGMKSAVRVSMKLPMPWEIVKDTVRGLLGREILTYIVHRYGLHSSSNNFVARLHDQWYHSLRAPYPLTAHYDHPIPYLLTKFIPTYAPVMLFRFHMLTYLLYLVVITLEETFAYSGYSVMPTSFFLGGIARRTDLHLMSGGEGNYGPWGVLDWIFGTTVGENIHDDVLEDIEEYEIDEKLKKFLQDYKKRLKEGAQQQQKVRRRKKIEK